MAQRLLPPQLKGPLGTCLVERARPPKSPHLGSLRSGTCQLGFFATLWQVVDFVAKKVGRSPAGPGYSGFAPSQASLSRPCGEYPYRERSRLVSAVAFLARSACAFSEKASRGRYAPIRRLISPPALALVGEPLRYHSPALRCRCFSEKPLRCAAVDMVGPGHLDPCRPDPLAWVSAPRVSASPMAYSGTFRLVSWTGLLCGLFFEKLLRSGLPIESLQSRSHGHLPPTTHMRAE